MKTLLITALLALAATLPADTIEFFDGARAAGAEDVAIRDGMIHFTYRGSERKRELHTVRSVYPDEASEYAKLMRWRVHEEGNDRGRLLDVRIQDDRDRIREPFVRVFVLEEDERGERELHCLTNLRRIDDPTRLENVDLVYGSAYQRRAWFAEAERPVAWRLEYWQDGILRLAHEEFEVDGLAADWWRLGRVRGGRLKDIPLPAEEEQPADEERPDLPATARITACRFVDDVSSPRLRFNLVYQVESEKRDEVPLPQATLHYVTEDAGKRRTLYNHDFGTRTVRLINGRHTQQESYQMPRDVANELRELGSRNDATERIIFWRVQLTYDDAVVAVRESADEQVRASLGKDWWK